MKQQTQFRGWWIPRDIVEEFQNGRINSKHLILLATIDSFCGKRGCFAGNDYLAELVKVKERRIIQMIGELVEIGLLTRKKTEDNGRELFTIWSKHRCNKLQVGGAKSCTQEVQKIAPLSPLKEAQRINKIDKHDANEVRSGFSSDVPFEKKWAKRLQETIAKQFNIIKDARAWPRILSNMQRFGGVSQERIKLAIKWYEVHAGDLFAPHIEDAQGFRSKFALLEKQMKAAETPIKKEIVLSDDAKQVIIALETHDGFVWPKGSKRDLPELVEASVQAYKEFNDKRGAIMKQWQKKPQSRADMIYFDEVLAAQLGGVVRFVHKWVRRVHATVSNWDEWRGQLSYFQWTPTHPEFRKMVMAIVPEAHHHFEEYMERLSK